jgi:tetratricopeptide (TPR) repeat protein
MTTSWRGHVSRLCMFLAGAALLLAVGGLAALNSPLQYDPEKRAEARSLLNQGVQAFKSGQFDLAIELFTKAKNADPSLINARLYLATTCAAQYIPGAPSEENRRYAQMAVEEFKEVLNRDADNISAIDGLGSILYNLASGPPLDRERMEDSKAYWKKHVAIRLSDPEPHYWIGVVDWSEAFRGNKVLREDWRKGGGELGPADPLPETVREKFESDYGASVDEGIAALREAIRLRPDYDDAMAYLNLLYRQKADMEVGVQRFDHLHAADVLIDRVKEIKQRRMQAQQPQQ